MSDCLEFIFKTSSLMAIGNVDKACKIEYERLEGLLQAMEISIDAPTLKFLASKFGLNAVEDKIEYVMIYEFLVTISCRYMSEGQLSCEEQPIDLSPKEESKETDIVISLHRKPKLVHFMKRNY